MELAVYHVKALCGKTFGQKYQSQLRAVLLIGIHALPEEIVTEQEEVTIGDGGVPLAGRLEIEEDEVPLANLGDCWIHWLILILTVVYVVFTTVHALRNRATIKSLITIVFFAALVVCYFFWGCKYDLPVTIVAVAVGIAGLALLTVQNKIIKGLKADGKE